MDQEKTNARWAITPLALFLMLPLAGAASGWASFEDYEAGIAGIVTGTGMSQDCTVAFQGFCSLKSSPDVCEVGAVDYAVARSLAARVAFSFSHRLSSTGGDTDTNLILTTNAGTQFVIHNTEGYNNQMSLLNPTISGRAYVQGFGAPADTWVRSTLVIDPIEGLKLDARVNGNTYSTGWVGAPANAAETITGLTIVSQNWCGSTNTQHIDTLSLV